jgi:TolB-like protein
MKNSFKLLVSMLFVGVISVANAEDMPSDSTPMPMATEYALQPVNVVETNIENTITSISKQLMDNKKTAVEKKVVVTSFVRLDNLQSTSEFGRIVGESLIHELSVRGFKMAEYRGQVSISVNSKGEYFITRKTKNLAASKVSQVEDSHIIVGTYSRQFKKVMLNARLIDNKTGDIISTARVTFQHDQKNDCLIFNDCIKPKSMTIVSADE